MCKLGFTTGLFALITHVCYTLHYIGQSQADDQTDPLKTHMQKPPDLSLSLIRKQTNKQKKERLHSCGIQNATTSCTPRNQTIKFKISYLQQILDKH